MKDDKAPAYASHPHDKSKVTETLEPWTEVPVKPIMPKPVPKDDGPWLRRMLNKE